mmetsp:Transcript_42825/g.105571  ORF Transcript_42825/g.105571 Transcript_42825/m.105571 type:complete len:309 (-) Transcript_42825:81-1007(-)
MRHSRFPSRSVGIASACARKRPALSAHIHSRSVSCGQSLGGTGGGGYSCAATTSTDSSQVCPSSAHMAVTVCSVCSVCSVAVHPGETVASTATRARGCVNESERTRVRVDARYGTCTALGARSPAAAAESAAASAAAMARRHSLSACSDALISAPSRLRSAVWCAESSLRSVPAQSTSTSLPAEGCPLPPLSPACARRLETSIKSTACEREEVTLAAVSSVARRLLPKLMTAVSSSAELTERRVAPTSATLPCPSSRSVTSPDPFGASRSPTRLPLNSTKLTLTPLPFAEFKMSTELAAFGLMRAGLL